MTKSRLGVVTSEELINTLISVGGSKAKKYAALTELKKVWLMQLRSSDFGSILAGKNSDHFHPKHEPFTKLSHTEKYMWSVGLNSGLELAVEIIKYDDDVRKI